MTTLRYMLSSRQLKDTVSNWQMNIVQHLAAGKKRKKKLNIWCVFKNLIVYIIST